MIIGGKTLDSARQNFKKSIITIGKKFRITNSNFVIKNALPEVKKFINKM